MLGPTGQKPIPSKYKDQARTQELATPQPQIIPGTSLNLRGNVHYSRGLRAPELATSDLLCRRPLGRDLHLCSAVVSGARVKRRPVGSEMKIVLETVGAGMGVGLKNAVCYGVLILMALVAGTAQARQQTTTGAQQTNQQQLRSRLPRRARKLRNRNRKPKRSREARPRFRCR